jgi:hypothetical protein
MRGLLLRSDSTHLKAISTHVFTREVSISHDEDVSVPCSFLVQVSLTYIYEICTTYSIKPKKGNHDQIEIKYIKFPYMLNEVFGMHLEAATVPT